ncbi:non-ribosomal peptide synthetase [Nostoc sp.]|uniref:non-ribosomal peptide synthetase n=1 Tax=Nostoc sp. TaxID=1180 RepID=UPI002FF7D538
MTLSPVDYQSTLTAVDFDPFADGELLLTAPATESQKEIWASVQMGDAANCAYNESQSLRLKGELDVKVFQSAVEKLVQRHEALRTTFSTDGNTLCIVASRQIEIPIIELSNLEPQEQQEKLASIWRQEVEQPFDLEHGPLFRAKIVKLQPQEHLTILTAHHIICDGWSWAVLMPDLGKLYSGLQQGIIPELAEPDYLSEYATLQEEEADSLEAIATEQYWLQQFADSVPVLDFPSDRPRPPLRTFNATREDWHLNPELVANLKQLGTKLGCSFMTTILGGFEVWLHRLTGQNDLVVGIPAAGQAALGQYNLVGHCVNLLPLRSQIHSEKSFSDYLRSRRSAVLDAYDHQQFTFGSLVKKLVLPRDSSRIPLVPIIFNVDQALDSDQLPFIGLEVEFFSNPRAFENFELFINATESHGEIILECQYNTNLFDADTIRRRMAEFETLLLGIVANPNQSIAKLPILPAVEQQLLATWNNTQTAYPQDICIHQLFETQVEKTPDAIAQEPGLTAEDTLLSVTSLSFDIAVAEIFLPLSVGGKLVLVSREVAADGTQLLKTLTTSGATFMQPTPVTWRLLLAAGWQGSPQLKMISTGEALPKDLANQLLPKGACLWNLYGPTETTIWSTGYKVTTANKAIGIGCPLANTQIYILDSHLQPVPIGISGELYIGGEGLARGYLNRPELTAERFISNPFSSNPESRLYKTGDLARYLPDGHIEYLGRIDYQVKLRGFRIELGEIETALLQHPEVKEAVVIVREDIPNETSLVGYIVAETGQDSLQVISQLRRFLKQQLPDFMVPTIFMALEAMPLTPNGKVDRKALPKPDASRPELEANYLAPRTPIEQQIADIWAQVLNVQQVGIKDNFFELGGYSLLGIQVVSRMRQALQAEILMSNLFELPTVADLAERVETLRWATQGVQAAESETADDYEEGEL